jgi:2-methylaconitate cis-trans-isomerase PrpF
LLLVNRNNRSRVEAEIPVRDGKPLEEGGFELDGVAFPGAEIRLAFLADKSDDAEPVFAAGSPVVVLDVPGVGEIPTTLVRAGNPTVIVEAAALGLVGDETQRQVNGNHELLEQLERIRSYAAVRMGMASTVEEASRERLHAPKIAWVAPASGLSNDDAQLEAKPNIDLSARTVSMGKLHHAITGTGAVAIAMAAAVPGTVVERVLGGRRTEISISHASGVMRVGAEAVCRSGHWTVTKAVLSRSARRLMDGVLMVPMNVPAGGAA